MRTIFYSSATLLIAVPFLTSHDREHTSLSSTVRPGVLTGVIYAFVMGTCALALLATLPLVYDHDTPLVTLGINIARSEERRVGKECRSRRWRYHQKRQG